MRAVVKKESLSALYKGNGAQMVRVFPYAATQFTAFEMYSQVCAIETNIPVTVQFCIPSCTFVITIGRRNEV